RRPRLPGGGKPGRAGRRLRRRCRHDPLPPALVPARPGQAAPRHRPRFLPPEGRTPALRAVPPGHHRGRIVSDYLPFVVVGLVSGSIYGIAGMGLVLTYKTTGIFNFAHGAVAAAAAYVFFDVHFTHHVPA